MKFADSLSSSKKSSIRYLASLAKGDNRTLLGRTLEKICQDCVLDASVLTTNLVKENLRYFPVPQPECWRINLLQELLEVRNNVSEIVDFTPDQITRMIDDICSS